MDNNDPIMQTRLDVAEMKGMLTQVVSNHEARLVAHDARLESHEIRLNDKAKNIARHDERIKDLEDDNTARSGKTIGTVGLVFTGLVGLIALFNFISNTLI